jgi:carbonic anhydrase
MFALAQHTSAVSGDQTWNALAAGNQRFVTGKTAPHDFPSQRKALTKTQHPKVAVLSCSDSRVPPELVFDTGLGELFVVRSAGEDDDPLSLGSLAYAIEHLDSTVIVVLGHHSCGDATTACRRKVRSVNLDAVLAPIAILRQMDRRNQKLLILRFATMYAASPRLAREERITKGLRRR